MALAAWSFVISISLVAILVGALLAQGLIGAFHFLMGVYS
jgi:hypothetical protein